MDRHVKDILKSYYKVSGQLSILIDLRPILKRNRNQDKYDSVNISHVPYRTALKHTEDARILITKRLGVALLK